MEEDQSIGMDEGEGDERNLYRGEEEEGENDLVVLDPSHVRHNLLDLCTFCSLYFLVYKCKCCVMCSL